MVREFFLEENRSIHSNNVEGSIEVDLSTKSVLLPNESISDTFSMYEQYNKERDNCNTFRLIIDVNPICSNVLYNMKSEMVIGEGTDNCKSLLDINSSGNSIFRSESASSAGNTTEEINYMQALRDTEYSNEDICNLEYHCGVDIFNNHMLRKNDFVHVNPLKGNEGSENFNTIKDYIRDGRGNIVEDSIKYDQSKKDTLTKIHLYQYDTILSMKDAFSEKCKEVDGWWGFYNPANINIPNFTGNSESININRMISNKKQCEFVDLYPDRSLFSFIPKYNENRNRLENNWDYCITYPYENDTNTLNTVCSSIDEKSVCTNASLAIICLKTKGTTGESTLRCSCIVNHNLSVGNYVNIYQSSGDTMIALFKSAQVISIGDVNSEHEDKIFTIKYDDSNSSLFKNGKTNEILFFKKVVNGTECKYYFRKFKKIKNSDNELDSDINKIAFGQNIYGDKTAQILFLNDINVDGLLDNLGRPVSELYFTVVKRNAGHTEWYDENVFSSSTIEASHCFGKVSSGLDMNGMGLENINSEEEDAEPYNYNVRRYHGLPKMEMNGGESYKNTLIVLGDAVWDGNSIREISCLEDDITIDRDVFLGDISEFDTDNCKETVLSKVCHRFNTAQRESFNIAYKDIKHDEITRDDYDVPFLDENGTEFDTLFTVSTYYSNDAHSSKTEVGYPSLNSIFFHGNVQPEGYFYHPHTKIQIKEEDTEISKSAAKFINYSSIEGWTYNSTTKRYTMKIVSPVGYSFIKGDYFGFYSTKDADFMWGNIVATSGNILSIMICNDSGKLIKKEMFDPSSENREYYAFWTSDSVPSYSKFLFRSRKFVWRKLIKPSELIRDSELYNMPFANGKLYVHQCNTFFLRRQDPTGRYGLSYPLNSKYGDPMSQYVITGYEEADFSTIKVYNPTNKPCV